MKAYIALGSNLGEPETNLERAGQALKSLGKKLRASPVFRTPALLPEGGPKDWNLPFLNAVVEFDWNDGELELLKALKKVELKMGRLPAARWAPRLIDLDLLAIGEKTFCSPELSLPHPEAGRRSFVLDPWKHLAPEAILSSLSILMRSRGLRSRSPLWMGILNFTPDSFSDGGNLATIDALEKKLTRWEAAGVQSVDLGAESTRPNATPITPEEEWARLEPALCLLRERYHGKVFRPLVSVDTRNVFVAERAIELGVDMLNDVSGLSDPTYLELLKSCSCDYVLMHSLSVPADPQLTLRAESDPVRELYAWAERKLEVLTRSNVPLGRVIFDPGLGFGKTADQSLELVKRVEEFASLPVRLLVGHSRKSFLKRFAERNVEERDGFSLGVSMHLASSGVEFIRVHKPELHSEAWAAFTEVRK